MKKFSNKTSNKSNHVARKLGIIAFGVILGLNLEHLVLQGGLGTFPQMVNLFSAITIVLLAVTNGTVAKEFALGIVSTLMGISLTVTFAKLTTTTLIIIDTISIIAFGLIIILKSKKTDKTEQTGVTRADPSEPNKLV